MNITERATELAHEKTEKYCKENNIILVNEEADKSVYTLEAQKIFDDYYDNLYSILEKHTIIEKVDYLERNLNKNSFYYVVKGVKYKYLGENDKGLNLAISSDNKVLITCVQEFVIDKLTFTKSITLDNTENNLVEPTADTYKPE